MKTLRRYLLLILSPMLLGGCYINSKGNICSLTLPQAYCDKEAYEQLTSPGKMVDIWSLGDRTVQVRLQDWMACGGNSLGGYWIDPLPDGKKRTPEQERAEETEKVNSIHRCMMRHDYEYIGQCTSSVAREFPPCRARAGEPWE